MESIILVGMDDPQLTGSMQDDPPPAAPGQPRFWHAQGGWQSPEEVGQPLVAMLADGAPVPRILQQARDVSGYEIALQRLGTLVYTDLEGEVWPGQTPTITSLEPAEVRLGEPNVTLRVLGTGFGQGSQICLDGEPVTTTLTQVVALATELQVEAAGDARSRQVTVRNPDGQESAAQTLSVQAGESPGDREMPVTAAPAQAPPTPDPDAEDPNVQAPPPHQEPYVPDKEGEDPNVQAPPPHREPPSPLRDA